MKNEMKKRIRRAGWLFFLIYIAVLVYFLFFSERYGRVAGLGYRYNLVPFTEIKRFFRYRTLISTESFLLNMVGNVVAFMPFGFFVPMLSRKSSLWKVFCLSFELTLTVETIQLLTKVGIFDVDDLMLNTLGGVLGYVCYAVFHVIYRLIYSQTDRKTGFKEQD